MALLDRNSRRSGVLALRLALLCALALAGLAVYGAIALATKVIA